MVQKMMRANVKSFGGDDADRWNPAGGRSPAKILKTFKLVLFMLFFKHRFPWLVLLAAVSPVSLNATGPTVLT